MDTLLTPGDVMTKLRISNIKKVYGLIHSGQLPAFRVGKEFRFSPEQVQSYLVTAQTGRRK